MEANNADISNDLPVKAVRKKKTDPMRERVNAAKEITELFKMERFVYVGLCGLAVILLLINAVMMIVNRTADAPGLLLLFGSGGLITFSTARLIYMWNKIIELVMGENKRNGNGTDGK